MSKFKLFSKWTALVGLNSLLCFILAISHGFANIQAISGIVLGIFTLVYVYMIIDFRLYQRKKEILRKWLFFGVLIQFVTQIVT